MKNVTFANGETIEGVNTAFILAAFPYIELSGPSSPRSCLRQPRPFGKGGLQPRNPPGADLETDQEAGC